MESLSIEGSSATGLAEALLPIVADAGRVGALHTLLGAYCHQSRNTLNSLKLSLYLARRDPGGPSGARWDELESRYQPLEQFFERLQTICRPMPLTPVRASLGLLMEERAPFWKEAMAERNRPLALEPPDPPAVGDFDPGRLREALDAFVFWRARAGAAGHSARLAWRADEGHWHVVWEETSPTEFNHSAERDADHDPLALPLLARVIARHGGAIALETHNGLRLHARWPLLVRP